MDFYIIDKRYVNELKQIDSRVGNVEYGIDKLKFHLGVIIKVNNKDYYVPVSSPKNKHLKMSDSVDFIKINHYVSGELLCILNLNNMIPVPVKYAYKLNTDYFLVKSRRTIIFSCLMKNVYP